MVRPNELVEAVLYALQQADQVPDSASFAGYEPDIDTEPIKLPLIHVSPEIQTDVNEANTEQVGYVTDDNGNQIGRRYETLYEQEMTISAWTAQGSKYEPRSIGSGIRDAIYPHTTAGPDKPLRHPEDDRTLDEVWRVTIMEGEHTDELGRTPTLRRWQQSISISASEQYVTDSDEPPIEVINARLEQDEEIDGFGTGFTV